MDPQACNGRGRLHAGTPTGHRFAVCTWEISSTKHPSPEIPARKKAAASLTLLNRCDGTPLLARPQETERACRRPERSSSAMHAPIRAWPSSPSKTGRFSARLPGLQASQPHPVARLPSRAKRRNRSTGKADMPPSAPTPGRRVTSGSSSRATPSSPSPQGATQRS